MISLGDGGYIVGEGERNFTRADLCVFLGISRLPNYVHELTPEQLAVIIEDKGAALKILPFIKHISRVDKETGRLRIKGDGFSEPASLNFFNRFEPNGPAARDFFKRLNKSWIETEIYLLEKKLGHPPTSDDLIKDFNENLTLAEARAYSVLRHSNMFFNTDGHLDSNSHGVEEVLVNPSKCPIQAFVVYLKEVDGLNALEFTGYYPPRPSHLDDYMDFVDRGERAVGGLYPMLGDFRERRLATHATWVFKNLDHTAPDFSD